MNTQGPYTEGVNGKIETINDDSNNDDQMISYILIHSRRGRKVLFDLVFARRL